MRKSLRARAHHLNPIVRVGQSGLSHGVFREVERALHDHELIKVKLTLEDRRQRRLAITTLCEESGAECIQSIGNVAVLYRPRSAESVD